MFPFYKNHNNKIFFSFFHFLFACTVPKQKGKFGEGSKEKKAIRSHRSDLPRERERKGRVNDFNNNIKLV